MKEGALIKKINKLYPKAKAAPASDFYGDPNEKGIWFRGSECGDVIDCLPMYDYWNELWLDTFGVNPEFEKFMNKHGWYCENYDAGTLMAYEN